MQSQVAAGRCRRPQLLNRPRRPRFYISFELRRRKRIKLRVERRMARNQLPLQVRRKLGDRKPGLRGSALHLVAIRLALGGLLKVKEPRVPARDLNPDVAVRRSPLRQSLKRVVWRLVAGKLRQKNSRSLNRL